MEVQGCPTSLDFTRQSNRWKKLDTERVPEIWERDPLSISMTIDHHMPEKKIPRVEERIHLKN